MKRRNFLGRRRTKIVCTIGPATSSEHILEKLVSAGMDCARLNFSHGSPPDHLNIIRSIRRICKRAGKEVAILQDLPGPKFRVGTLSGGSANIKKGSLLTLTTRKVEGNSELVPLRTADLPRLTIEGSLVFLSDGAIRLRVLETSVTDIECRVETGGLLLSGKGVNVPRLKQSFETFTERDKKFLSFGLDHGVDFVAVSFVRSAQDVESVRKFIERRGGNALIVAKIEKKEAIETVDKIIKSSDALMVARGDLGVENPIELVPEIQKQIISNCNVAGIPVITATQMLESMVSNPSPTRAEVSDVANSIFDGTDAVMLSEETAVGKYPVQCVKMLHRISVEAEKSLYKKSALGNTHKSQSIVDAMSLATAETSVRMGARAILTNLRSIVTLPKISRIRSHTPILAVSESESELRKLKIVWGVFPIRANSYDKTRLSTLESLVKQKIFRNGDRVLLLHDSKSSGMESLTLTAQEIATKQREP